MISHIKNISVGLWLHKRETHTISKYIQVVCELELYTQGLCVVPATQGCQRLTAPLRSRRRICTVPPKKHRINKNKSEVCLMVGRLLLHGVCSCNGAMSKTNKNICVGLFTHLHALLQRHGKHTLKIKLKNQKSVEIQVSFKGTVRLAHPSSGCPVSGPWSFCCSRGPRCAASRCSEPPRGARVLENKKVVVFPTAPERTASTSVSKEGRGSHLSEPVDLESAACSECNT